MGGEGGRNKTEIRKGKLMNGSVAFTDYINAKTTAEKIAIARTAPKVSSEFLEALPDQLGMSVGETAKAMGVTEGVYYRFRSLDECPAFFKERADEVLAEKGIKPAEAPPPRKKQAHPESPRAQRTKQADMVPADFLNGLEERLGIEHPQLLELLGVKKPGTYYAWKKRGRCPAYIRAAVSGLLAERKIQTGELTTRKPKKAQLPAVVPGMPPTGEMVVIQVLVPRDQTNVAAAMLAALGYPIQVGR